MIALRSQTRPIMTTSIISIQSQVVFGHVGNSAAVLPMLLRRLDVAAAALQPSALYPTMRGRVLDADLLADLLRGVEERGLIETARLIVTGYLGSRVNADVMTPNDFEFGFLTGGTSPTSRVGALPRCDLAQPAMEDRRHRLCPR